MILNARDRREIGSLSHRAEHYSDYCGCILSIEIRIQIRCNTLLWSATGAK